MGLPTSQIRKTRLLGVKKKKLAQSQQQSQRLRPVFLSVSPSLPLSVNTATIPGSQGGEREKLLTRKTADISSHRCCEPRRGKDIPLEGTSLEGLGWWQDSENCGFLEMCKSSNLRPLHIREREFRDKLPSPPQKLDWPLWADLVRTQTYACWVEMSVHCLTY